MILEKEIGELAVGHLHLGGHARRLSRQFKTIGDLIASREQSSSFIPLGAERAQREIDTALEVLFLATSPQGVVDWDQFRKSRPPRLGARGSIYFFSPSLNKLSSATRHKSLAALNLKHRAINALRPLGIQTIGELIDRSRSGIERLPNAGALTLAEINDSLAALSVNTGRRGEVDWVQYGEMRGFLILPRRRRLRWSLRTFLQEFPKVANAMVNSRFGNVGVLILRERILRSLAPMHLKRIGQQVGAFRQRVSLIEQEIVEMLRLVFSCDEYPNCKFRVRPEFLEPIRRLAVQVKTTSTKPSLFSVWERRLAQASGVTTEELTAAHRLIFEILSVKPVVTQTIASEPIILPAGRNAGPFRAALKAIERLLTSHFPRGLTPEELYAALKKRLGSDVPAISELPVLVRSASHLEFVDGRYRATISGLKKKSDRYERVLLEAGRPLRLNEIALRVWGKRFRSGSPKLRPISFLLSADDRFIPISVTGYWGLRDFGFFETRKITDIAVELLEHSSRGLHESELFDLISERRPVSQKSIPALLNLDERFRRVGARRWQLT